MSSDEDIPEAPAAGSEAAKDAVKDAETPKAKEKQRSSGPSGQSSAEELGQQLTALTNNYINGPIYASGATIGTGVSSMPGAPGYCARTGRLTEAETTALCGNFAEPSPFPAAASALKRDQVVLLAGPPGLGKRASAVRMLLAAGAESVEAVSPTLTLQQLSEHDFEAGHGYLVENWQQAPRSGDADDFNWRVLRDHVREAEVHLVLTATNGQALHPVTRFAWEAPSAVQVLSAHLGDSETDTAMAARVAAMVPDTYPGGYSVGRLADIARKLAAGAIDEQQAATELSNDAERYVSDWLSAEQRTDGEILSAAALCFAAGQSERIFELMVKRLELSLREAGLFPDQEDAKTTADGEAKGPDRPSGGLRKARTRSRQDGLLIREQGIVRFHGEEPPAQRLYQQHVLSGLWGEFDITFWIAVRKWLDELISDTAIRDVDIQVPVAAGLALLARAAPDEVEDSYLHAWAAGELSWSGQATAVYVLWQMCEDETLAPVALRIATNWVNSGDSALQWTAAAALSGYLGAVYPPEAASRIWHLVLQWKDVPTKAVTALASLFATLTRERGGQDAVLVLELLQERIDRTSRKTENGTRPTPSWRDDRRNRERALLCLLAVITVQDPRTKQPSVTSFLVTQPEHRTLAARLWAVVLRHRPYRVQALKALIAAVKGLEFATDDPEAAARALGDALTDALPGDEHQPLKRDLNNVLARSKRPEGDSAATIRALLEVFENLRSAEGAVV